MNWLILEVLNKMSVAEVLKNNPGKVIVINDGRIVDIADEENNPDAALKEEVEQMLECKITDDQFEEALEYAKHKQEYIYDRERREFVMQPWYLAILTKEYVISLAFSKLTMDLSRTLRDMEKEKEHSIRNQSAPTDNHIVAVPTL